MTMEVLIHKLFLGFLLDFHLVKLLKLHPPLSNFINLKFYQYLWTVFHSLWSACLGLSCWKLTVPLNSILISSLLLRFPFFFFFFFFFVLLWTAYGQIFYFLASTFHYICSYPHLLIIFLYVPKGRRGKICHSKISLMHVDYFKWKTIKPQKTQEASLTFPLNCLKDVGSRHGPERQLSA